MNSRGRVRFKICCISSIEEARLAVAHGASALGLVASMPSGPGVIPETLITEISATIPPGVASFLLTSHQDVDAIVAQQRRCGVNTIQICDRLEGGSHAKLREALPGIGLVQVVHVLDEHSIEEAVRVSPHIDAILLDSGNPNLETKELGGTGRTHNWELSRAICESIDKPVYLAGGLNPDNVRAAVREVKPFGVDLCSGVRTDDNLDESKLSSFCSRLLHGPT